MIEDSPLGHPEDPGTGAGSAANPLDAVLSGPAIVRILFVTDSNEINDGLLPLADAISDISKPHVTFQVTRKVLANGVFSPGSLVGFDELWLFGFQEEGSAAASPLSPAEIEVIARFMDSGGGVLATGDHETRGGPLCGEIPRVRNMRKWLLKDNPPPRDSGLRHDSLVKGPGSDLYVEAAQSDETPQVIFPVPYTSRDKQARKSYPHPLLSAPDRVITVLPDHMHEGQCCVPDNLNEPFPLPNFVEYPEQGPGRLRQSPEVVARSILVEAHLTFVPDELSTLPNNDVRLPFTQVNSFNLIGAYDGHAVVTAEGNKPGRVVVDSSFHHFIEQNVKEFREAKTAQGKAAYKDILQYFYNIALWLAPPELQKQMRDNVLLLASNSGPIVERLRNISARFPGGRVADLPFEEVASLGELAESYITSLSSISMTLEWSLDLIRELPDDLLPPSLNSVTRDLLVDAANPWLQDPRFLIFSGLDVDPIMKSVIGGALFSIDEIFKDTAESVVNEAALTEARNIGVAVGAEAYVNKTKGDPQVIAQLSDVFKEIFI